MAIIFAVLAAPLVALAGLVLDYAIVEGERQRAQNAADAAVLAALSPSAEPGAKEDEAKSAFLSNFGEDQEEKIRGLSVSFEKARGVETAQVEYSVVVPLFFGGFFGHEEMVVPGRATATVSLEDHIDIRFWLDDSASMGVAATEADRDRLRQISNQDPQHKNCAFACHLPTEMKNDTHPTTLDRANALGIHLRIDVMRENVRALIETLQEEMDDGRTVRFQLSALSQRFRRLTAITTDVQRIQRRLNRFRPSGSNHSESASRLGDTLVAASRTVPNRRPRGTAEAPRQYVVLVTDGMQFDWHNMRPGPIDPAPCEALKRRGVNVAVVQLRYVALTGDGAFNQWVRPYFDELGPALERCASEGLYFSGDTPEQIRQAFTDLALRLKSSLRVAS
jgi:Flp pilus assembly protein TadG